MRGEWSPEELVESWTLLGDDWKRVGKKSGATRLGFAVLLKFFELEARFPRAAVDVPSPPVEYVAEQVGVPAARFADYWQAARALKRHRVEIRGAFGFREATRGDEEALTAWLAEEVCPVELGSDELVDAVLVHCRALRIEPPGRLERIVGSARARFEQRVCAQTVERLGSAADCSEKLIEAWRARAVRLYPSDLRASPAPIRLTLLAALCWRRQRRRTVRTAPAVRR